MYNPVSKIDELFPDFAELDQTVTEMQERQNQITTDFNFIIRQVAETAKKYGSCRIAGGISGN
ncbi:hypothetical protein GC069_00340 [Neisseria meningitidis]|nr:hypothetical protein [Neisseria meningitidis]